VHEASLVVEKLSHEDFLTFSDQLFAHQQDYFDEAVENKTRRQLVEQVAELIVKTTRATDKDVVIRALANGTNSPENKGNSVTNDLKLQIRLARQNSIHVSPTVVWNGLRDDSVSSGWDLGQWQEYIKSKL
jgi:protein-disulfide isomerase